MHASLARRGLAVAVAVAVALAAGLVGCGDDLRRVELRRIAPAADPGCGLASDGVTIQVTALGDFPAIGASFEARDGAFELAGLPDELRQLEVVMLGAGGAERTIGKTAPFELGGLDDDAAIGVLMAPEAGFCEVGPSALARPRPLVQRAGSGVLVTGDEGIVEWYDPATAGFLPVDAPAAFAQYGLAGAAVSWVPSGGPDRPERVVFTGGLRPAYFVFDPATRTFVSPPGALFEVRGYHAAVALDDHRLLLAGGCGLFDDDDACTADSLRATSQVLDLDRGELRAGPNLTLTRAGGSAVLEPDGRVVLFGGVDATGAAVPSAERIDPAEEDGAGDPGGALIDEATGATVALASGATLAAFGPDGAIAVAGAATVPPGAAVGSPAVIGLFAPRAGATLAALENGSVLIVGGVGDPGSAIAEAALYSPYLGTVRDLAGAPGPGGARRVAAAAVRLPDGSVLVLGGRSADADADAVGEAWVFRPALTGPFTSALTITPGVDDASHELVPLDPASARRVAGGYVITAQRDAGDGVPRDWAVVAGPELVELAFDLTASASEGLALIVGFRGPGELLAVALEPGTPPRLTSLTDGAATLVASCPPATALPADALAAPTAVSASVRAGTLAVTLAGAEVLRCQLAEPPHGLVGFAPLGAASTAEVTVSTLAVSR